jgi:hypothetical protein
MSATPPGASGALLDQDTPDTIRLSVAEATALGERALRGVGLSDDDVRIIVDQLIDNALCGYPFASLPRILAIAQDAKTQQARQPMRVVHETPVSALLDGGNNVGYVAVYRATQVAIDKAQAQQFAVVRVYNSYYSGRNAYYMEMIVKAGLVGMHLASAQPHVVPPGGTRPALGTNPLCFGFPSVHGPVIFDIGTSALMWGEVLLHAHLDKPLPAGPGVDKDGNPTTNARDVLLGGVLPFGGHKGHGPPRRGSTGASMARPAAWQHRKVPVRLVSMARCQSSSGSAVEGATIGIPAALTNTSTWPNASNARSTARRTASASRTSAVTATARRPSAWISSAVAAISVAVRLTSSRSAPSRA